MNEQNNNEREPEAGWLYPETVEEMLTKWDNGETVWTVEMGGLGPGYEQAIQVAMIELCRAAQFGELTIMEPAEEGDEPVERYSPVFDAKLQAVNRKFNLGLSGSQASAAMQIAYRFLTDGPRKALLSVKEQCPGEDRLIQIDNSWPGHAE